MAQPAANGTRLAESIPGTGVPHPISPMTSALTDTPAASTSQASWRRTWPSEERQRATTATTLANAHYDRIASLDPSINSYLALSRDRAFAQAAKVDAAAKSGNPLGSQRRRDNTCRSN